MNGLTYVKDVKDQSQIDVFQQLNNLFYGYVSSEEKLTPILKTNDHVAI